MDIVRENGIFVDSLTGAFNKRKMKMVFDELSQIAHPMAMFMVDIDDFKEYNQVYGYEQGDVCLRKIANVLSKLVSICGGYLFRFNNDEFIIILPDTDKGNAVVCGNEILHCVRELNISCKGNDENILTVSIGGISFTANKTETVKYYVKRAEMALYMAKRNGKNQIEFDI